MNINEWLDALKNEKPELKDFATKLEKHISDNGFNQTSFERAVNQGLKQIEERITNPSTNGNA